MFPPSSQRVPLNTEEGINRRIALKTRLSVVYHAAHPEDIPARLRELEAEWDIERVLETNASSLVLLGLALGAVRPRWLVLSAGVAAFLLQHAVEGWCPPLPLLRRLGYRTAREIGRERNALRILRGDIGDIPSEQRTAAALTFARTG